MIFEVLSFSLFAVFIVVSTNPDPTLRNKWNNTLEAPIFGTISKVNPIVVQRKDLDLEEFFFKFSKYYFGGELAEKILLGLGELLVGKLY